MKRYMLLTAMLCLGASFSNPAEARLGETAAQLVQRYGQPISQKSNPYWEEGVTAVFRSGSYLVEVTLVRGKAETIEYETTLPFDDSQIFNLLELNNQGLRWTFEGWNTEHTIRTWTRSDEGTAEYCAPSIVAPTYRVCFRSGYIARTVRERTEGTQRRLREQETHGSENF